MVSEAKSRSPLRSSASQVQQVGASNMCWRPGLVEQGQARPQDRTSRRHRCSGYEPTVSIAPCDPHGGGSGSWQQDGAT
ncbi:ATP F0F1 synthase subunit alpha [Platysternon megacephalum]|uniref:ATP F0F1 synthase subunit alpha n=1 Tax=Platysternon megacephalum TaxID=55544 RepID=A0A4D9DKD2_9SAUR|nr:ATP F0F1 synthase subunit alpha [Platysternon megacephalum]